MKYSIQIPDIRHWQKQVKCQEACPIHTDSGRYVQLIAEGQYEQAYLVSRSPNPFASVCGRVCAAPCEDACRRGSIDSPVSIRALKRFVTEKFGAESLQPDTQEKLLKAPAVREAFIPMQDVKTNQYTWHLPTLLDTYRPTARKDKIAVIGSGPSGLSCAHDLALMGYPVTVFEASDKAGGMMRHGIPEYRLPRAVIDKEIEKIIDLGVELKLTTPLTQKFGINELKKQGYKAIFISVGVQQGRDLKIEGADQDGVIKAIDYLLNINNGYKVDLGKKVLVIGGGFVAFDAARTAVRAGKDRKPGEPGGEELTSALKAAMDAARLAMRGGAAEVHMASLESFSEMPVLRTSQGKEEFEEAKKEGIRFHPQRGPKRILGKSGKVTGIELTGVKRTYDENGKFSPIYDSTITETFECDSVVLAIGQKADTSFLDSKDGVTLNPDGTIRVNPGTLETTASGIFAGGDAAFGPKILIDGIANGKRAAESIDRYIRKVVSQPAVELEIEKIPTRSYSMFDNYEKCERESPPTIDLNRRTGISEVETGYDEEEAKRQAQRCLYCHVQTVYDAEKCVMCDRCVDICPEYCLKLVPVEELDLPEGQKQLLMNHYHNPETAVSSLGGLTGYSAMLKDDEKCIRCGLCAVRCPTDAMTMEVFYYEEREQFKNG